MIDKWSGRIVRATTDRNSIQLIEAEDGTWYIFQTCCDCGLSHKIIVDSAHVISFKKLDPTLEDSICEKAMEDGHVFRKR